MSSPLARWASREEPMSRKIGNLRSRVSYPAENWTTACLSQESGLSFQERRRTVIRPFHRLPAQAWLEESNVKLTGQSEWPRGTTAMQTADVLALPLFIQMTGYVWGWGLSAWNNEVDIWEKGDRSWGGNEIKKTHRPWCRKNTFTRSKTYCKEQIPSPSEGLQEGCIHFTTCSRAHTLGQWWSRFSTRRSLQSTNLAVGHKHLCQILSGLQAPFLLGGLSIGLGGIGLLSLACEAVRGQVSFSQHLMLCHLHSLFYFSTINSDNNFHKEYIWELKS